MLRVGRGTQSPGFALYNVLLIHIGNFNQFNHGGTTSVSGAGPNSSNGIKTGPIKKLKLQFFAGYMKESADACLDNA